MRAVKSPTDIPDKTDPGDDVQRRFRYQYAYGVILLFASLCGKKGYRALYCEHHEDFLGERDNSTFDAYQLKTRQSEEGPWKLSHPGFFHSIGRFAELETRFPNTIQDFNFVSNAGPFESNTEKLVHLCPVRLLNAVTEAESPGLLQSDAAKGFVRLVKDAEREQNLIFQVLKRTKFLKGPPLDGFASIIAHEHVIEHNDCRDMPVSTLDRIVEQLIGIIFSASSIAVSDPSRHYAPLNGANGQSPEIKGKRVPVEMASLVVREAKEKGAGFRYLKGLSDITLPRPTSSWNVLQEKMENGGIGDFFEWLRRDGLSAERHLMDLTGRSEQGTDIVNQLASLVATECDRIRLQYVTTLEPHGPKILYETDKRFFEIASQESARVYHQPQQALLGLAALLAGDCKVWWGNQFQLRNTNP